MLPAAAARDSIGRVMRRLKNQAKPVATPIAASASAAHGSSKRRHAASMVAAVAETPMTQGARLSRRKAVDFG